MTTQSLSAIPVAFPNKKPAADGTIILAADIGGTKTNLALFRTDGPDLTRIRSTTYKSADFESFGEMVRHFHSGSDLPHRMSIGVAGPVINDKAGATNLGWEVDARALRREFGIDEVYLLNDLEANAYGLAALDPEKLFTVNSGNPDVPGNAAIISPGTGLGEAGLFWDGKGYHPFATEGGHADFSPRSALDVEFLQFLHRDYDHVSWERVVSGMGIHNIFRFLHEVKGHAIPPELAERIKQGDPAKAIGEAAQTNCFICVNTMSLFIKYLAIESANLVLKFKATGGLYIGGGIVPKMLETLKDSDFFAHFIRAGRLKDLMEAVSVKVILDPEAALLGAGWYGVRGRERG